VHFKEGNWRKERGKSRGSPGVGVSEGIRGKFRAGEKKNMGLVDAIYKKNQD